MIVNIIFIIIGFILLIKGADFLVDGASNVAKKFNIPTLIIGLTIVSIGTSMPELMVSTTAAFQGHSDISIGNIIGSNMANLFLILGICSIIKSLKFKPETVRFENPIMIFATALLLILGNDSNEHIISKTEGIILLIGCGLFILYNIIMAKRSQSQVVVELAEIEEISILKSVIYILIGIVFLKFGGDFVVEYASKIAQSIGISEKIISVTIIAFSTSLPELITSINATIKGDTDMAIGNVIGSQTFNILLIIGVSAVLCPINYSVEYNADLILLHIGTIVFALFPYIGKKNEMTRYNGIIFTTIYILYLCYLVYSVICG